MAGVSGGAQNECPLKSTYAQIDALLQHLLPEVRKCTCMEFFCPNKSPKWWLWVVEAKQQATIDLMDDVCVETGQERLSGILW